MAVFDLLKTFIFLLSSILLYPVLILLALAALYVFWAAGRVLGEWIARSRAGRFDPFRDDPASFAFPDAVRRYRDELLAVTERDEAATACRMRQAVAERQRTLDAFRLLIRLAPALGLLGTLIPMGTALAGVGQGNFQVVSGELVVAFTTTVVGLAAGSAAFLFYLVKRRWVAEDVRMIEFVTEKLAR